MWKKEKYYQGYKTPSGEYAFNSYTMHGDSKSAILGGLDTSLSNFSHSFNMLLFNISLGLILTSISPKVILKNLYGIVPHAMY